MSFFSNHYINIKCFLFAFIYMQYKFRNVYNDKIS